MIQKIKKLYARLFWSAEKYAVLQGVKIGQNCSIDTRWFGSEPYLVEIGNHVQITNDVRFFTHGGSWVFRLKNPDFDYFGKIKIGDNVYIGNCAFILPGVTIGDNVIVGAGAIVTKSVESGSIVAGNPARVVGSLIDLEKKLQNYNVNTKKMNPLEKKEYLLTLDKDKFIQK